MADPTPLVEKTLVCPHCYGRFMQAVPSSPLECDYTLCKLCAEPCRIDSMHTLVPLRVVEFDHIPDLVWLARARRRRLLGLEPDARDGAHVVTMRAGPCPYCRRVVEVAATTRVAVAADTIYPGDWSACGSCGEPCRMLPDGTLRAVTDAERADMPDLLRQIHRAAVTRRASARRGRVGQA